MPPAQKPPTMSAQQTSSLRPRNTDCSGWNCLTAAEQFGIIFSIVVTSIVLLLAYMYYLGRITSSHQEIVLARRRRRRRRPSSLVTSVSMGQLPVIPHYPSQPQQVFYQPVLYSLSGGQVLLPQSQGIPGQHPVPMFYPAQPIQFSQPRPSFPPHFQGNQQGPPAGRPASPSLRRVSRQPTWRQRLCRAFGLPLGRASTVASSAPGTPVRSRSQSLGAHESRRGSLSGSRNADNNPSRRSSQVSVASRSRSNKARRSNENNQDNIRRPPSPGTDVATVHSDDYDLIPAPEPVARQRRSHSQSSYGPQPMGPRGGAVVVSNNSSSDIDTNERQSLPTVSSIRPAYDASSRPPTPIPLDGYCVLDRPDGYVSPRIEMSSRSSS
ncbi:hypothetical protein FDECE_7734 [Fusarium decemcellulare]|nr:hypothetical protein FDECE_7734 [Fusarium decemcellulare]